MPILKSVYLCSLQFNQNNFHTVNSNPQAHFIAKISFLIYQDGGLHSHFNFFSKNVVFFFFFNFFYREKLKMAQIITQGRFHRFITRKITIFTIQYGGHHCFNINFHTFFTKKINIFASLGKGSSFTSQSHKI